MFTVVYFGFFLVYFFSTIFVYRFRSLIEFYLFSDRMTKSWAKCPFTTPAIFHFHTKVSKLGLLLETHLNCARRSGYYRKNGIETVVTLDELKPPSSGRHVQFNGGLIERSHPWGSAPIYQQIAQQMGCSHDIIACHLHLIRWWIFIFMCRLPRT